MPVEIGQGGNMYIQNTHFLRAARSGNLERITHYLEERVDINTANQVSLFISD